MDLVIGAFKKDILELRMHINFIENLKVDILPLSRNYEYSTSRSKKRFEYNSLIISLYGIVENFTEQFSYNYIEAIERIIPFYDSLDKTFTDSHFNLSIQLINKIIENKHSKYSTLNKVVVMKNLSDCLMKNSNYKLNKEAFTINTGNLKHSKICDTYSSMNIKINEKLRCFEEFNFNTENVFNKIDDLVQRRNEIAHGSVENILDISEIIPFIDFVEKYLESIGQILKDETVNLNNLFKKKHHSVFIKDVTFFKGNIIGITDGRNLELVIGDEILIERIDNSIFSCNILEVREFPSHDITIRLDRNIRDNFKFYKHNKPVV